MNQALRQSARWLLCLAAASAVATQSLARSTVHAVGAQECGMLVAQHVLSSVSPVRCDQLAVVRFGHIDFDGTEREGEIMVLAAAAGQVQAIFDTLLQRRFPIAQARTMEAYRGDDAASMRDNNTSGFNDRAITGGGPASLHAYGLAIDLNPVQNPYLRLHEDGRAEFAPPAGSRFANRREPRPGKPARRGMAEEAVRLFARHGFTVWGGDWDVPIDYQHFQVKRDIAEQLARLPAGEARQRYDDWVQRLQACLHRHSGAPWNQALVQCSGISLK